MNALQFFKIEIYMEKNNTSKNEICTKKLNCAYNVVANVNNSNIMHKFVK